MAGDYSPSCLHGWIAGACPVCNGHARFLSSVPGVPPVVTLEGTMVIECSEGLEAWLEGQARQRDEMEAVVSSFLRQRFECWVAEFDGSTLSLERTADDDAYLAPGSEMAWLAFRAGFHVVRS